MDIVADTLVDIRIKIMMYMYNKNIYWSFMISVVLHYGG